MSLRTLMFFCGVLTSLGWLIHKIIFLPSPILFCSALYLVVLGMRLKSEQEYDEIADRNRFGLQIRLAFLLGALTLGITEISSMIVIPVIILGGISILEGTVKPTPGSWFSSLCQAATISLILINGLLITQGFYTIFHLTFFDTQIYDFVFHPVLQLLGPISQGTDKLFLSDARSAYPIHLTADHIHLFWAIQYLVVCQIVHYLCKGKWLPFALFKIVLLQGAIVLVISTCFFVLVWNYTKQPEIWVSVPLVFSITLFSFLILLPFISSQRTARFNLNLRWLIIEKLSPVDGLAVASGFALALIFFWFPLGTPTSNDRILVDDAHSPWERSDLPFDYSKEGMTKQAAYSYTNFIDYLSKYHKIDVNSQKSLADYNLNEYAVLLLKTPTQPFTKQEIASIKRFVKNGGGLFVHSDHTNLFGMSAYLNELLNETGVQFNYDDQASYQGSPSKLNLKSKFHFHPSMQDVNEFKFLTSCTLSFSSPLVEPVLISDQIFSENAFLGNPGFFGNMAFDATDRFGAFVQSAVVPYGKGRIAVFCDSTVFSNFTVCQSDYLQYALYTINYLKHRHGNIRFILFIISAILFISLLGAIILRMIRRKPEKLFWNYFIDIISGYGIGIITIIMVMAYSNSSSAIRPGVQLDQVAVVLENGELVDPLTSGNLAPSSQLSNFSSFILAIQRSGYFPHIVPEITDAIRDYEHVIWINPSSRLSNAELQKIANRIRDDGIHLLVVDSALNNESTCSEFLNSFGLNRTFFISNKLQAGMPFPGPILEKEKDSTLIPLFAVVDYVYRGNTLAVEPEVQSKVSRAQLSVVGGEILLLSEDRNPIFVKQNLGKGSVFAYVDSIDFSNYWMGGGFMTALNTEEANRTKFTGQLLKMFFSSDNQVK